LQSTLYVAFTTFSVEYLRFLQQGRHTGRPNLTIRFSKLMDLRNYYDERGKLAVLARLDVLQYARWTGLADDPIVGLIMRAVL
jgi:hypothetical protein